MINENGEEKDVDALLESYEEAIKERDKAREKGEYAKGSL